MMSTKQAMVLTGHHEIPWMPARTPSLSSDLGLAHFLRTVGPAPPHRLGLKVVHVQTRGILGNSKLHEVT